MRGSIENKWLILRTAGRSTLPLAASLSADGFNAWTPIETRIVRVPRVNAKRQVKLALMPGFVFASARHLLDLLELASLPQRPRRGIGGRQPAHEGFSVFHAQDRIPLIDDSALEPLRAAEAVAIPKLKQGKFKQGQGVRVLKGNFAGLVGIIEKSDSHTAQVWLSLFGRHMRAKIPAFLLQPDDIGTDQRERVPRHRNAAKYLGQEPIVGKALFEKCEACNDDAAGREAVRAAARP